MISIRYYDEASIKWGVLVSCFTIITIVFTPQSYLVQNLLVLNSLQFKLSAL